MNNLPGNKTNRKVLFSDESTFQQFVVRKRHVRRPTGKRFHERYTIPTVKYPPSHMVWGAMSRNGVAALSFLPPGTTMNGPKYVQMLTEAKTSPASSQLSNIYAGWRPLPLLQSCKKFSG